MNIRWHCMQTLGGWAWTHLEEGSYICISIIFSVLCKADICILMVQCATVCVCLWRWKNHVCLTWSICFSPRQAGDEIEIDLWTVLFKRSTLWCSSFVCNDTSLRDIKGSWWFLWDFTSLTLQGLLYSNMSYHQTTPSLTYIFQQQILFHLWFHYFE